MVDQWIWMRSGIPLVLLSAGVVVIGCERGHHPPVLAPPAGHSAGETTPFSTSFWARNWTYHLRRFAPDAAGEGIARQVWGDLFAGMAKDAKTRSLLKRLHGGLPVEFVVLDDKQAQDNAVLIAPPPEGNDFVMRVADLKQEENASESGPVLVRYIAYSHVILLRRSSAPTISDVAEIAKPWQDSPLPGGPISLAMDDYILRHAPGWIVIGGPYSASEKLPSSVEEQRRDLERKIGDYAEHATAYYGAIRRQP